MGLFGKKKEAVVDIVKDELQKNILKEAEEKAYQRLQAEMQKKQTSKPIEAEITEEDLEKLNQNILKKKIEKITIPEVEPEQQAPNLTWEQRADFENNILKFKALYRRLIVLEKQVASGLPTIIKENRKMTMSEVLQEVDEVRSSLFFIRDYLNAGYGLTDDNFNAYTNEIMTLLQDLTKYRFMTVEDRKQLNRLAD